MEKEVMENDMKKNTDAPPAGRASWQPVMSRAKHKSRLMPQKNLRMFFRLLLIKISVKG